MFGEIVNRGRLEAVGKYEERGAAVGVSPLVSATICCHPWPSVGVVLPAENSTGGFVG